MTTAKIAAGAVGNTHLASGIDASKITVGALPAINGANLTNLNASSLTGALPAISGANLTSLNAANMSAGTLADVRLSGNVALLDRASQNFTGTTNTFAGNLGIGTTTPGGKLEIANDPTTPHLVLNQKVASWGSVQLHDDFRYIRTNYAGNPGDGPFRQFNVGASGVSIGYANVPTYGSSDALYVNGRVGIGTTSPGQTLEVNGISQMNALELRAVGQSPYIDFTSTSAGTDYDARIIYDPATHYLNIVGATQLNVVSEITCVAVNLTSDRNAKEQFKPVNARDVLDKVARLPISEWQYKTQADARHIGPMAQDLREAFALGHDERHIASVDADGVALAAIQGLNEKLEAEVKEKDAALIRLQKENQALAKRLTTIEQAIGLKPMPAPSSK